jgi:hypothetical protein
MRSLLQRILGPGRETGEVSADDIMAPDGRLEPHPARAPEGSAWAEQKDVDFFVSPALTMDTLSYLHTNGAGPEEALRERFELPPVDSEDEGQSPSPVRERTSSAD